MSALDWDDWIARSPSLSRITPAALGDALDSFRLGAPRAGLGWLARAIQGAFAFTLPVVREAGCTVTVPNATEAKAIYGRLSAAADNLLAELARNSNLLAFGLLSPDQFAALSSEVERAASVFAEAAQRKSPLQPRWRQARVREERIRRATLLSPIFEIAYGRAPAVNNWPDSDGGPWPDFYSRIMALVFGDNDIADLSGVLVAARRIDDLSRVTFSPNQIPEYPA